MFSAIYFHVLAFVFLIRLCGESAEMALSAGFSRYSLLEREYADESGPGEELKHMMNIVATLDERAESTLSAPEIQSHLGARGGRLRIGDIFGDAIETIANPADGGCLYYGIAQCLYGEWEKYPSVVKTVGT